MSAKQYAEQWETTTAIERKPDGTWAVFFDPNSESLLAAQAEYDAGEEEDDEDEETDEQYIDRMWQEEHKRFIDEISLEQSAYVDGQALSEEDGWYYED